MVFNINSIINFGMNLSIPSICSSLRQVEKNVLLVALALFIAIGAIAYAAIRLYKNNSLNTPGKARVKKHVTFAETIEVFEIKNPAVKSE